MVLQVSKAALLKRRCIHLRIFSCPSIQSSRTIKHLIIQASIRRRKLASSYMVAMTIERDPGPNSGDEAILIRGEKLTRCRSNGTKMSRLTNCL